MILCLYTAQIIIDYIWWWSCWHYVLHSLWLLLSLFMSILNYLCVYCMGFFCTVWYKSNISCHGKNVTCKEGNKLRRERETNMYSFSNSVCLEGEWELKIIPRSTHTHTNYLNSCNQSSQQPAVYKEPAHSTLHACRHHATLELTANLPPLVQWTV